MSDVPPTATTAAACFDCGYDLRGLPPDARCPECGTTADESARRYERLREWGGLAPVRRGTGWALIAVAAGVTLLVLGMLLGFGTEYGWWSGRVPVTLVPVLATAATLTMAASAWRAAATLRTARPPGERAAGRLLTLTGWVLPTAAVATWTFYWFSDPGVAYGNVSIFDAVEDAVRLLTTATCVLYGPALLWVLYNRVRLWPRTAVLPRLLRGVTLVMVAGITVALPALAVVLYELVTGGPVRWRGPRLYGRVFLSDVMQTAAGAGWIAYLLATPAALLLIASVFGRVGKLAKSLAARPVAPAEEVGQERQPLAVRGQVGGVE